MADNETIADIIAWLRKPREGENAYLTLWRDEIADRLKAAHKRERGVAVTGSNQLREALVKARRLIDSSPLVCIVDDTGTIARGELCAEIDAALAAPATAEKSSAVGDAAKLREALDELVANIEMRSSTFGLNAIVDTKTYLDAKAALAAPPRNCDVGTAQEQDERFHRFCVKHHTGSCAGCHNPVGDYTVANGVRECALVWAQMPYEEGGAK